MGSTTARPASTARSTGGSARPRPAASRATCSSTARSRGGAAAAGHRHHPRRGANAASSPSSAPDAARPSSCPSATSSPRSRRRRSPRAAARAARAAHRHPRIVHGRGRPSRSPRNSSLTALGTRIDGRRLELTIDADKLRAALGPALAAFEQAPVDATFQITAANTVNVVPSAVGRQVDLAKVGDRDPGRQPAGDARR